MEKSPAPNSARAFESCCAKCRFARPVADPGQLKIVYRCMWGPPTPILMMVQGNPQPVVQSIFPVLDGDSSCYRFEADQNPLAGAN